MTLLDTNLLVHATSRASPHHAKAKALCEDVYAGRLKACVALQNLCEWYSVVTNPRRVTHPLSVDQAAREFEAYLAPSPLRIIAGSPGVLPRLPELLRRAGSRGAHVFDVVLVATMLDHDIDTLYTENVSDFSAFSEIQVINPFAAG